MAMENPPYLDEFPFETSVCRGFSIAMFDYWMVGVVRVWIGLDRYGVMTCHVCVDAFGGYVWIDSP